MLAVSCDSRAAVDAMNEAAAKHGGTADINTAGRRQAGLKRDRVPAIAVPLSQT